MSDTPRNQPGYRVTRPCGCILDVLPDGSEFVALARTGCQEHDRKPSPLRTRAAIEQFTEDVRRSHYEENEECEKLAQREGDRLLRANDEKGSLACFKIAAILRARRDQLLSPF